MEILILIGKQETKSSASSVIEPYISNFSANPFPLADDCLAAYTILFKVVAFFNLITTSFAKLEVFLF